MKKHTHLYGAFALLVSSTIISVPAALSVEDSWNEAEVKSEYVRPDEVPTPEDNLYTKMKDSLGKKLFFDPRLSGSNFISCATCHNPALGWEDGMAKGTGDGMKKLDRHTPTVLNTAYGDIFMWDGREETLESQALGPIGSTGEMNQPIEALLEELRAIDGYQVLFKMAFPEEDAPVINKDTLGKAIATYERTIISGEAPFDRWIAGDEKAISKEAKLGFKVFNTKAKCNACHSGWNFSDDSFHDIGLKSEDPGRGKITGLDNLQNAFKTPGLRDIVQRAPYMHDGSLSTLREVVEHYNSGAVDRKTVSADVNNLGLTEKEVTAVVAFLETLTGKNEPVIIPVLPQ